MTRSASAAAASATAATSSGGRYLGSRTSERANSQSGSGAKTLSAVIGNRKLLYANFGSEPVLSIRPDRRRVVHFDPSLALVTNWRSAPQFAGRLRVARCEV